MHENGDGCETAVTTVQPRNGDTQMTVNTAAMGTTSERTFSVTGEGQEVPTTSGPCGRTPGCSLTEKSTACYFTLIPAILLNCVILLDDFID